MKKFLNIVSVVIIIFASFGCLDITTKVTLKPDGSGTIVETTLMSDDAIKMLASFSDDTTGNGFEIYNEKELIEKAASFGEGVKFVSSEKIVSDGKEGMKAIFSFGDISKVNIEGYSEGETGKDNGEPIKFKFKKGTPSTLEIIMPEPKEESIAVENEEKTFVDSASAQFMEGMKETLSEIRMAVYFEFVGKIIDTDASYRDGNKITLVNLDFRNILNDPEAFEKIKYSNPKTLSDIDELIKDVPGVEIELKDKIFVKFE